MEGAVRAIYEQGRLRLLDPVSLTEGQEIEVLILSERERARAALGDLLIDDETPSTVEIDEESLFAEIDSALGGNVTVSDVIIEERREGP